jgi:2-desacetyl-2-hydroxyethyl bacteriochlorophyllide A dehydrogenase
VSCLTAELTAPRQFRLAGRPIPRPGAGEVLVRVAACGICGSDLHNYLEGGIGDTPAVFPMVLGHEPCGTVAGCGEGVGGWSPGDRVALEPAIYCYHCEYCLTGRHNVCARLRFLSQPGDPGFFREYAVVPAASVMALPPSLSLAEGALFEPLAVAIHSLEFVGLRPGESVAVFGAGPIGLLTVAMLRLAGAGRIWSVEPVPGRRELARRLGADAAIDPSAEEPAGIIAGDTGGRGADAAIDCATQGDTINLCVQTVRRTGRVVVTGIPSELRTPLDFHALRRKEAALFNVRRSNHNNDLALRLLATQPNRFVPILTHRRPLSAIAPAFELLAGRAGGAGKVVIEP